MGIAGVQPTHLLLECLKVSLGELGYGPAGCVALPQSDCRVDVLLQPLFELLQLLLAENMDPRVGLSAAWLAHQGVQLRTKMWMGQPSSDINILLEAELMEIALGTPAVVSHQVGVWIAKG